MKLPQVPVIVRDASDRDVLEMALIENLQREDLDPLEEAEAYARLAREFGLKQEESRSGSAGTAPRSRTRSVSSTSIPRCRLSFPGKC